MHLPRPRHLAFVLLVLATSPGCLYLLLSAEPSCPDDGLESSGEVLFAEEGFTGTVDPVSLNREGPAGTAFPRGLQSLVGAIGFEPTTT